MKKLILLSALAFASCRTATEQTNFEKWQNCLEKSNYSDSECRECDRLYNYGLDIDLPEEINQASQNDTLKAVKKGNTIYITF